MWVKLCYTVTGKEPVFVNVYGDVEQRNYFSFYDYEYYLDGIFPIRKRLQLSRICGILMRI